MFTVGLRIYYTGRDGLSATWKSCCSFAVEFRGLQDPRSLFSAANYCKLPWKLASLFSFVLFLEKLRPAQFWTCWLASSVKPGGPDSVSRLWPMHCCLHVNDSSGLKHPVDLCRWYLLWPQQKKKKWWPGAPEDHTRTLIPWSAIPLQIRLFQHRSGWVQV